MIQAQDRNGITRHLAFHNMATLNHKLTSVSLMAYNEVDEDGEEVDKDDDDDDNDSDRDSDSETVGVVRHDNDDISTALCSLACGYRYRYGSLE
jgi:hypothetical protein